MVLRSSLIIGIPETKIPHFWPFTVSTYDFHDNKISSKLYIIVPFLLSLGLLSQLLLWLSAHYTYPDDDDDDDDDQDDGTVSLEEWLHQEENCEGCAEKTPLRWHRYKYNTELGEGRLYQVSYTLYNFWEHWLDNGLN